MFNSDFRSHSFARVLALLFIFVAVAPPTGASAAEAVAQDVTVESADAHEYAEQFGVPVAEASRRLRLQQAIGDLQAELLADPNFAGLWIDNGPEYGFHAAFRGERSDILRNAVRGTELAELVTERQVKFSIADLEAQAAELVSADFGQSFDLRLNVQTNGIDVLVASTPAAFASAAAERGLGKALASNVAIFGVPHLARPNANIYGGLSTSSGDACTFGFAVKTSTKKGITTAGHCDGSIGYGGVVLPLQPPGEQFHDSHDEQWHSAPGFTVRNWVKDAQFDSTSPYWRTITAKKSRSQQASGMFVCKYGRTTGYTCGTIVQTSFWPAYVPSGDATFIQVTDDQNLSSGGDSGGPWYSGNTAFGVHSGETCFITGCNDAIYVATNYVESGLGVTIMTAP